MLEAFLQCWGKARPRDRQPYHPAAYHCLDVAACAQVILERLPLLRRRLATLLDVADPATSLPALIALHDVGKFSRAFQRKSMACWRPDLFGVEEPPSDPGHATSGFHLWSITELWRHLGADDEMRPLAQAVFGHHGAPIRNADTFHLRNVFGRKGLVLADGFATAVIAALDPQPFGRDAQFERASWLVAGLTVLADWIGSSQEWFPYCAPDLSVADYWQTTALPNARKAVDAAGIAAAQSASSLSYPAMTGVAKFDPTPMQMWATDVRIAPGLYIIEDSTGAGKTEAALMLAHRLIAGGLAEGLYVALPTMATADGMYGRMGRMYRSLFSGPVEPSLALSHGARDLNLGFQAALRIPDPDAGNFPDAERGEDVSYCNAWIADDRRKAFLAQVGVGTIDQALLSILPAYHQSLRVLGLAQRVLVLDEVHAYDAYMNQEIIRLLEMQAALGGTTILLSATLPIETKARLVRAYGGSVSEFSHHYPLATFAAACTKEPVVQQAVAARPQTVRTVPLSFEATPEAGFARAVAAARAGQAVLDIRNSVADAIETFSAVPDDIEARLFHARFAMCDRQIIQGDVIERFGPNGTSAERSGQLLVATQVVEQSLDLDFDLIVTDLAPIDLVIQRAGRLWRHDRGSDQPAHRQRAPSATREMIIVGPQPDPKATEGWLRAALRRSSFVYRNHAQMWLTAQALHEAREIKAPGDLRRLVEHVYGADAETRVPEGLRSALRDAARRSGSERAAAVASMLKVDTGYAHATPWDSDERVLTRLGADSITLRLAAIQGVRIVPWAAVRTTETDPNRLWALSEVSLRGFSGRDGIPAGFEAAAQAAKSQWSPWQRDSVPLVVVDENGETPAGLIYCSRLGLRRAS
ncbi:MAG: CRISPR-associated helicase Cas3' [Hyphomicrobiaceae bacterium]